MLIIHNYDLTCMINHKEIAAYNDSQNSTSVFSLLHKCRNIKTLIIDFAGDLKLRLHCVPDPAISSLPYQICLTKTQDLAAQIHMIMRY